MGWAPGVSIASSCKINNSKVIIKSNFLLANWKKKISILFFYFFECQILNNLNESMKIALFDWGYDKKFHETWNR